MAQPDQHTFDFLTGAEGDYMEAVMSQLAQTPWAIASASQIFGNNR